MLTVDGRCTCHRCEARTTSIYRMIGVCRNCGATPILMLFRAGDPATPRNCPTCGGYDTLAPLRLATEEETP
jgi:hypothetical protein